MAPISWRRRRAGVLPCGRIRRWPAPGRRPHSRHRARRASRAHPFAARARPAQRRGICLMHSRGPDGDYYLHARHSRGGERRVTRAAHCTLPDFHSAADARAFSFGTIPAASLSTRLQLTDSAAVSAAAALHAAATAGAALRDALLSDTSPSAKDFALWAERIAPIDVDELPPGL
eukprot:1597531-Pleurochrysis_carterae.AAC.1